MAILDPTGGLVAISELNTSTPSLFREEFTDSSDDEHTSDPLVHSPIDPTPAPPRKRRRTRRAASAGVVRNTLRSILANKKQVNDRLRLFLRITSLIASGTTLGALGSVLYTYQTTDEQKSRHSGGWIWPKDLYFRATHVMLAAAVTTFAADLGFFIASAKAWIRNLEGAVVKTVTLAVSALCLALLLAAFVMGEAVEAGGKRTLMWTCTAKSLHPDETAIVDFPFLCGEIIASRAALGVALVLQSMILLSVLFSILYRQSPRKPKAVVGKGFKVVSGWRGVLDRVGL